jgi:hypothetical protein
MFRSWKVRDRIHDRLALPRVFMWRGRPILDKTIRVVRGVPEAVGVLMRSRIMVGVGQLVADALERSLLSAHLVISQVW